MIAFLPRSDKFSATLRRYNVHANTGLLSDRDKTPTMDSKMFQ
jgi:hypothetical protein